MRQRIISLVFLGLFCLCFPLALQAADKQPAPVLEDDFSDEFAIPDNKAQVADPLYYFNYGMYVFNDKTYHWILEPTARGYKAVMPQVARVGIKNFFHNLVFPVRFVNTLLQGKWESAVDEVGIFLVNTTAGGLGFYQFAQNHLDVDTDDEDFGQTLGSWSLGEGCYLVLPFFGPTSLRDGVGSIGDIFLNPVTYVGEWEIKIGARALDSINGLSFHLGDYEALTEASLDPYEAIKAAYIQRRRALVKDEITTKKRGYIKRL
ncbi:MAG: VacJ family lipoprotein [Desulfobacterales bacterium]|nr:VacJ family lipoprotein [Desulfobacterales bacterium]